MSADRRQTLHELVDRLPAVEIEPAREALAELLARAARQPGADTQARIDRRMLEAGMLRRIPTQEDLNRPPPRRERLPGKMASDTLLEDRGE